SAAQPASASSSTAVVSSTQQIEQCESFKSIVPFTVAKSGTQKYDLNKPITFPCNKDGFDMDLDIETQDDLYLMLSDKKVYSPSDSVIEIAYNFSEKQYKITEGVVSQASSSSQAPGSSKAFNGRIRIMYTGYYLNIYINNEGEPFIIVENKAFKALYFGPKSGKVDVTFGHMFCYGEAECEAFVAPSTIAPTSALPSFASSALPSLTSSALPTFSSSAQPSLTPSATPVLSSSVYLPSVPSPSSAIISPVSSSQSSSIYVPSSTKVCDKSSSFMNASVTSAPFIKMYDVSNPILVPCSSPDFQLDFDVDSDSDLYVAFTDFVGFSSASGYSESYFGFSSGNYDIKRFTMAANKNITTNITQPRYSGHLTLTYKKGILSLYDSDEFEVSYKVKNLDIKQVFISPYTGTAKISNGLFTCSSVINC
ncbi:hypothetical protein AYI70_g9168, partial [Smittium culicis]